ncbi:uncharacterized protein At3g49140 isoform X1 [Olea europaea subsp. europaea]|uniref:Uncharacterized protein At3g49140 isoform X1 n=1 Tax=Olea europaea subsp. europaea TaxID=158383 RepID=A0A8S0TYE0_OLEEU|nr:uncharacterized protein At3g49140 isoform X1 [Olea europaea subsp. europaea]
MLIAAAIPPPSSSFYLGPFHCHICQSIPFSCSTSYGVPASWIKPSFELQKVSEHSALRCENAFFGATLFNWFPIGHDSSISRVSVAADYSDSVPDSSNYVANKGYHPLEELRDCRRVRDKRLTSAEIARTAVEANSTALLIFPGIVHCEPHEHISWAEFEYVIDEFGDIFFEIFDGENILQYRETSNPVNVLIGMDLLQYENRKIDVFDDKSLEADFNDDILFDDDDFKVEYSETSDARVDWGMPENSSWIHPVYFTKCLTEAVNVGRAEMMDYPSNGVSILGIIKPAFIDEELYLRRLFDDEDSDGYTSDLKDGDSLSFNSRNDRSRDRSTIYKLEITKIELFSVYGVQSVVGVQDFQYAEPDVLVHSTPAILEHFGETDTRSKFALKALCKKKGLDVEVANLIGVDSLGMDVRVSSGTEVQTHRFPFKVRATSECAAEKQIQQLLFPRSQRKKLKTLDRPSPRDTDSF